MQITARYDFRSPPDIVWEKLLDPEVVGRCLPGCETLEPLGADKYRAALRVGIAAIRGRYEGTVAITEQEPPQKGRFLVEGSGTPGFVRGESLVLLTETAGGSSVDVTANVEVAGMIARVGQRVLGRAARMILDQFFGALKKEVSKP